MRGRRTSYSFEPVAHAADGLDVLSGAAQFPSQADHLHVHRAVRSDRILAADRVENLVPGEHPPRPACQEAQKVELCGGQVHRIAPDENGAPPRINFDVVDSKDPVGRRKLRWDRLLAAQHGANPGEQHPRANGLVM